MAETPDSPWGTALVWFRRDLRISDNPALVDAIARSRSVVPVYVLEPGLTAVSASRTWFLLHSLAALDAALRARGSGLVVREGTPEAVVAGVAREFDADVVLATRDVTPRSHQRDQAVATALARDGRSLLLRPGLLLAEPEQVHTGSGRPYEVFTPFWRALQAAPRRTPLPAPTLIETPAGALGEPFQAAAGPPIEGLPEPGEPAATSRLQRWVTTGLGAYKDDRNLLSGDGTSRLGADLHFGLLSPIAVETAAIEAGEEATAFVRQLAWREFYQHQAFHHRADSGVPADPLMGAFRSEQADPEAVAAWREGRTGIPAVDAAMRQLASNGWMSNRARLVVASFLTRHLLMDYRIGERHFMRHLIDGDVANNRGGWRWTAGVGSDPQPWFRIFNPVLQGRRFDPDGAWVRRWIPELADVPDKYVHAPWESPHPVKGYPGPIVDLAAARARALAAFKSATGGG